MDRRKELQDKDIDRRMQLMLSPQAYATWRAKEDARVRELNAERK